MSLEDDLKVSDREARQAILKLITAKAQDHELNPGQIKDLAEAYAWARYPNQPH